MYIYIYIYIHIHTHTHYNSILATTLDGYRVRMRTESDSIANVLGRQVLTVHQSVVRYSVV